MCVHAQDALVRFGGSRLCMVGFMYDLYFFRRFRGYPRSRAEVAALRARKRASNYLSIYLSIYLCRFVYL